MIHTMPLLGSAAMLLSFDVEAAAIAEHDRWHTHEHLPERLSIPGFLRGTRWVATGDGPRYMLLYEVADLAVLTSGAYLERLNKPSAWTSRVMPHYRGMRRGLCAVEGSAGFGLGGVAALVRFEADGLRANELVGWLLGQVLPDLVRAPGIGSAHLLKGAAVAAMTAEQRIRGSDGAVDRALIVTGYDDEAVAVSARQLCAPDGLPAHGAGGLDCGSYRFSYSLARTEIDAGR